jgi:hypothetical protein
MLEMEIKIKFFYLRTLNNILIVPFCDIKT